MRRETIFYGCLTALLVLFILWSKTQLEETQQRFIFSDESQTEWGFIKSQFSISLEDGAKIAIEESLDEFETPIKITAQNETADLITERCPYFSKENRNIYGWKQEVDYFLRYWKNHSISFADVRLDGRDSLIRVWIVKNQIYYDTYSIVNSYGAAKKIARFHFHLASVLECMKKQVNIVFLLNLGVKSVETKERLLLENRTAPRALFSLNRKRDDYDILIPNPYFEHLSWWSKKIHSFTRNNFDFGEKLDKIFWRGECGANFEGSKARLKMALLSTEEYAKKHFSFSWLDHKCLFSKWSLSNKTREKLRTVQVASKMDQYSFSKFKYLLNLPGQLEGTYSRNLQTLLALESIVLQYKNEWYEFYYAPELNKEFEKAVVLVDETNVIATVQYLHHNEPQARKIAMRSKEFFIKYISPPSIVNYWALLLELYGARINFDVTNKIHWEDVCFYWSPEQYRIDHRVKTMCPIDPVSKYQKELMNM